MRQLIYSSVETPELAEGGVFQIIHTSARKNTASDLGGFLIYLDGSFLQLLEGPDSAVTEVFERISHDTRHTDLAVLRDQSVETGLFERWAMRRVSINAADNVSLALGELEKPVREAGALPIVEQFVQAKLAARV